MFNCLCKKIYLKYTSNESLFKILIIKYLMFKEFGVKSREEIGSVFKGHILKICLDFKV